MLLHLALEAAVLAVCIFPVNAHPKKNDKVVQIASESVALNTQKAVRVAAPAVATSATSVNGVTVNTNTTTIQTVAGPQAAAAVAETYSVNATILVFARDADSGYSAFSGLNAYGIPYQLVTVPQAGIELPVLNSSATAGNYGGIVLLSEVSYDYGGTTGFQSALNATQLAALYQYQVDFGVRMVRLDVFPSADSGTSAIGGCCNSGIEQNITISNATAFSTAGLKTGAPVSTLGLWHYPATITNSSIATEFAQFQPSADGTFPNTATAAVINNISGRQQMVFFTSFATDWAATSNFLQHAWIHWITRGLYAGYRRVNLNTQVDDMFLETDMYSPNGTTYQVTTDDLAAHVPWMKSVNARLNPGSEYFLEICHNGNGNIEDSYYNVLNGEGTTCGIGPIEYADQVDTPLEFVKPLGSGTNIWPSSPTTYPYSSACPDLDPLKTWWSNTSNLNAFAHISHTFTHEDQDNATYFDVYNEITWNQAWLSQVGIASADRFSPKGLVPPAITGLHNGDALRAWVTAGITNVVGDNTRSVLMNSVNEMWPLMSTVASNGYAGVQINPRWATNIYYNCQLPNCTVLEWINTNTPTPSGDWYTLLGIEKATNTRHLLGLHHDPFMFHQANLNYVTAGETVINGVSQKLSMLQAWVETVTQEMIRLVDWPIISLKHDDFSTSFANRMTRDNCHPELTLITNPSAGTITGVSLTADGNTCSTTIPITVPGSVTDTQGFTTEQIGNDPLTIWVSLTGSPVNFTLSSPVSL